MLKLYMASKRKCKLMPLQSQQMNFEMAICLAEGISEKD